MPMVSPKASMRTSAPCSGSRVTRTRTWISLFPACAPLSIDFTAAWMASGAGTSRVRISMRFPTSAW